MSDFSMSDMVSHLLNKHERAILQFSGGKDSLAILNLCKSHLNRILVVHLDTGARLPHMDSFIREAVERVGGTLRIIRPEISQQDSIRMFGLPIDIAPLRKTIMYKGFGETCVKIQSSSECCYRVRWAPMDAFINENTILDHAYQIQRACHSIPWPCIKTSARQKQGKGL